MFLVPTYLAPSAIHGTGVFAAEAIERDTRIWEFTPEVDWRIPPADFERFPEPYLTQLRRLHPVRRQREVHEPLPPPQL